MKLKSIELIGFKSFARKTKITFHPGITEIVGPNGSGKSNIIEAIRWALGEQSAKNLRSSRMTDVIFSGSQSHPALNRAKVTLDFDNSDHLINTNYDDLTVSRSVYRDGTNNYYINNEPCRLRDVQDLFMNTGIGNGSFSIISQGKVSQIFKSKPEDRRFIIETVAGIYKYRSQKEMASKKLLKVNDNLNRLEDINYDLADRMRSLSQSRKKALSYLKQQKLANRLDTDRLLIRANLLTQKRVKSLKKYQSYQDNLGQIRAKVNHFKLLHLKLQNHVSHTSARYDQFQDQILLKSHQLDRLSNQRNLNQQKVNFWQTQIKRNLDLISQTNQEIDKLNQQMFKLTNIEKRDSQQIQTLKDQIKRVKKPDVDSTLSNDQTKIQQLRTKYLTLIKRSVAIKGQINNSRQNRHSQVMRIKDAKDQAAKVKKLSTGVIQQINSLNRHLAELNQNIDHELKIFQESKLHQSRLNRRLQQLRRTYQSASRKQQTLMIRVNGLKRMASNHSNLNYGTRNLMNNASRFPGIWGPVAKFITVPDKYIQAIETTLRSQLQQIIVDNSETAKRAVRFMTERRLGRVTLLPVNEITKRWVDQMSLRRSSQCPGFIGVAANLVQMPSQFSAVKAHLLGNVLIAKDVTSAINVSRAIHRRYRVVTLDGNVVNAGGAITGGHGKYRYHGLLSQKAKLEQYQTELKGLNQRNREATVNITKLQDQLNQAEQKVSDLQTALDQQRQKRVIKTNLRKRLNNEARNYQKLLDERQELTNVYKSDDRTQSMSVLEQTKTKLEAEITDNQNKLKVLQQRVNESNQADQNQRQKYQGLRETLIKREGQKSQDVLKKTALSDKVKQATQKVDHCHQSNVHYRKLIDQQRIDPRHDQKLKQVQANIDALRKKKKAYHQLSDQDHQKLSEVENQITHLQNKVMTIKEQINQNRLTIHDLERKQNEVRETLLRKYKIDLTQKSLPKPKASLYQISSKLLDVQKSLRKIGPVDVNSIERFKKVNHRYQFLSNQVKDLVTSKKQLITTMNQMNSKIISRFKKTFDQVNRAFKSTYAQIFRGGKAKLTLLDPHHLLTTGINIMAQPPGKRYRNMELLSGGERALTAIALLFAILKIKPAPFCILDEAESALDAINIDRFGDYMQKLKAKTQFIVITHRKTTMLYADNLYGVTMQHSGISKIISVNLQKARTEG